VGQSPKEHLYGGTRVKLVYVISRDNAKFFVQFKVNIANKFFSGFFILNFYIGLAQLVSFYSEHVRGTGRKN
jgi:hypothetical protein